MIKVIISSSWTWGLMPIIPVLRKWIQEDLKFKARLSYIASPKLSWIHEILSEKKKQQSGIMMHACNTRNRRQGRTILVNLGPV